MVQVIPANQNQANFGSALGQALSSGLGSIGKGVGQHLNNRQDEQLGQQLQNPNISDIQRAAILSRMSPEKAKIYSQAIQQQQLNQRLNSVGLGGQPNQPQQGQPGQPISQQPTGAAQQPRGPLNLSLQERAALAQAAPDVSRVVENHIDSQEKAKSSGLKDTSKLRSEVAQESAAARDAIENQKDLLEKVKAGELDDPTYAALAELIPFHLGERFLSPGSVEYRSQLINEYNQLKTIFKGQTRVEEIKLLNSKLAHLYLTDEQKDRVLNNSIKKLEAVAAKGEIAAEIEAEHPEYGSLRFQNELNKRLDERKKEISNQIVDEYQAITEQAEALKKTPLDNTNPEHVQILKQFYDRAAGNKMKAAALLKKEGYQLK